MKDLTLSQLLEISAEMRNAYGLDLPRYKFQESKHINGRLITLDTIAGVKCVYDTYNLDDGNIRNCDIVQIGGYKDGKWFGKNYSLYAGHGGPSLICSYHMGKLHGVRHAYTQTGQLVYRDNWENGKRHGWQVVNNQGILFACYKNSSTGEFFGPIDITIHELYHLDVTNISYSKKYTSFLILTD
jgi:hypothetical protein